MEWKETSRREFLTKLGAGLGVTAIGLETAVELSRRRGDNAPEGKPEAESLVSIERNEFFDRNEEYLRPMTLKNGEWSKEQRKARRRVLTGGEQIFDDVGLSFYLVKKGDTISEIRQALSQQPEFAYLSTQQGKLDSFNIPAQKLRADMWIPIPIERKDRHLEEAQFAQYAAQAIDQMADDARYGEEVRRILERVDRRTLLATMIAIAKQEAGGEPLGLFELHRWEDHQKAFSFSYFHVLMNGAGLTARKKLNLTEGQLYHPQNAVKLFLAFLVEKSRGSGKHADRFFPISENDEAFARFYNGKQWKKINPHYLDNLRVFLLEADAKLSEDGLQWKKEN